ncbi:MAG: translocation/assembly module TamB domain-containing protein [Burkholderiales bacterium]
MLAAVTAAAGAWVIARTDTAVWLLTKAAGYAGLRLKIDGATGSLLDGIAADSVEIIHADGRIGIRGLSVTWDSLARLALRRHLIVPSLVIDRIEIEQASTSGQAGSPPASLTLPISLRVDRMAVGSIVFKQGIARSELKALHAHARIDASTIEVWIDALQTSAGNIVARARIAAESPFAIDGEITISNQQADLPYRAEATLGGELALIGVGGTATIELGTARAALVLTPFGATLLERIDAFTERVDPAKIREGWPHAALDIRLRGGMRDATRFAGDIDIHNHAPGALDALRVPVRRLGARIEWTGTDILVSNLKADLGQAGRVQGTGRYAEAAAHLDLATDTLNLAGLHSKLHATRLAGTVGGTLSASTQHIRGTLRDTRVAVDFDVEHAADRIDVRALAIRAGAGRIEASGAVALTGGRAFAASGRITDFDPASLGRFETATLNAEFEANGHAAGDPSGRGRFVVRNSKVRGFPIEGVASIDMGDGRVRSINVDLSIAGNTVQADGILGAASDTMQWRIDAQHLGRLGLGIEGSLQATGVAQGALASIESTFSGKGGALVLPGGVRIESLSTEGRWSPSAADIRVSAQALSIGEESIDSADVTATGTLDNHALRISALGPRVNFRAEASGGLASDSSWRGKLSSAELDAPVRARLRGTATLEVSPRRIALQGAELQAGDGVMHIDSLAIEGEAVMSRGRFSNVDIGDFLAGYPALKTDLTLSGAWDITSREALNGSVSIHRERGDIGTQVGESSVALGLSALRFDLLARQSAVEATLSMQGSRLGEASGRVSTRAVKLGIGWTLPDASPVEGDVRLDMRSIAWLGALVRGAIELDGQIAASARISGTVGSPRPTGTFRGEQLRLAFPTENIALTKGTIDATFDAARFNIVQSSFQGDAGSIRASGFIGLGTPLAGEIVLDFDQLEAISDPSQTLKLSGQVRAKLAPSSIALTGSLRATEGRIRLPDAGVPRLGEDVVVKRARQAPVRDAGSGVKALKLIVDINVDLGDRFAFEGRGVKAVLSGRMRVQTSATGALRITGPVRVEEGTVTAYGKSLDIDKGSITFTGPIDNPQLNLTATRRGLPHRVGVHVTGFAQEPRATLFSEPAMPNSERLSWLVMGRSSEGLSATDLALLGTAASAILADPDQVPLQNRVAGALGFDELAMRTTGELESSVVAVGKRISDKLYVTVERNVIGLGTALALRYQFNKNWSLQGQTGLNNTVDLLYTVTFD